jgi:FtsP/CotA-like multicopper oxidase with cupredoxin domain
MTTQNINRRDFLRLSGLGFGALLLGNPLSVLKPLSKQPEMDMPFEPDAEIDLTAAEKWVQILPGAQTRVWSYYGNLKWTNVGDYVTVTNLENCYLGPIIRVKSGTKVRINFHDDLGEDSVLHPHGLHVLEENDGQPMQAIHTGEAKVYDIEVIDRAGPYWFHPHPMGRTAEQVVMGLAGLFPVWDDDEVNAIPGADTGANDKPVIIQDRMFDSNNQILYQPNNMWGYLGDKVLVNGGVNATMALEPRGYRLRFLNGSNARTYKLAWSNAMKLQVIGTDGGLLPAALPKSYVMLMPGERVDVWADFSGLAGKQLILKSQSFSPMGGMGGGGMGGGGMGGGGMGGGGMGGGGMMSSLANGAAFNILTINVGRKASVKPVLGKLPPLSIVYDANNVPNFANPRPFTLEMSQMVWTINHRVYNMVDMMEVAEDEMVWMDETMAWEWINNSPIPHPMHIHNCMFQVLGRTSPGSSSYATANQGFVDSGWKDTVIVWPGERVRIAMTFSPYSGMYMYHCHILEHEDMTMMRNYMIMDPDMPMSGM